MSVIIPIPNNQGYFLKKLFFLCFAILSVHADIGVKEAWEDVCSHSDTIKIADDDIKSAKLKVESAKSMYLPSISLSASYTHLSEPVNVDTSDISKFLATLPVPIPFANQIDLTKQDVFLADLNLLWPLYTGGKIDAAQDIYAARIDETKAKKEMKEDIEFIKFIKYYYGVVVSKSLLQTRRQALRALTLHYQNAKKLKDEAQIANIELLHSKVKLDSAKIEYTDAKHKLEIAQSALFSITHTKELPSSKLFVNSNLKDEEYYKSETKRNYPALKIIDAKTMQSNSLIKIKESGWLPKVAAYGNYNLYRDDSLLMETLPKWFAGVMIKIDLLKRADRSQEIEIAKLLNAKIKHTKSQAIEGLKLLVEKTYKQMLSSYEEFNALSSSLSLARENYRLRELSFNEGLSTSVELVDAEMFLMGAKTKRLNAAYNFVKKVSQLCVLSGDRDMFFEIADNSQGIKDEK